MQKPAALNILRDLIVQGKHGKPILVDIYYLPTGQPKPIIVFSHGFKGFKDWGHFPLVAQYFANKGFVFVKFNFSHNGTTSEQPTEFADLEAFGNNNISKELDDLGTVINFVSTKADLRADNEIDLDRLYLIGHSRGGAVSILKAFEDDRVKKLVTWASVKEFGKFWDKEVMDDWKKKGVLYVDNARTGQRMPLYWQYYEDFFNNKNRLDVPKAAGGLKIPFLIVHGTDDPSVPYEAATSLHKLNTGSKLLSVGGANHVFGGRHPYKEDILPPDTMKVVKASSDFLRNGAAIQ